MKIQNHSFYHSAWFWAGALLSLGGAALLTISLLAQFQVIHQIGSFSHQSITYYGGASAINAGLGATGSFLLASIKKTQTPQSTPSEETKKSGESPSRRTRESERSTPQPNLQEGNTETGKSVEAPQPDSPDESKMTRESLDSSDELSASSSDSSDSTRSKTIEKKGLLKLRKKNTFHSSKIWVYGSHTQIVDEKEIVLPSLEYRLELYGFLPKNTFKKLEKQFSNQRFDYMALKAAIKDIEGIVAIVYRGHILLNRANHAIIKTESSDFITDLREGEFFPIEKEDRELRIFKNEKSSPNNNKWESIPIRKPSWDG